MQLCHRVLCTCGVNGTERQFRGQSLPLAQSLPLLLSLSLFPSVREVQSQSSQSQQIIRNIYKLFNIGLCGALCTRSWRRWCTRQVRGGCPATGNWNMTDIVRQTVIRVICIFILLYTYIYPVTTVQHHRLMPMHI